MSFEAEMKTGSIAKAGSEQTVANFNSKLLLPIPHSPRIANELVLPVDKPCCSAWLKTAICALRPTNASGLAGKLGSGSMRTLQNHRHHNRQFTFVILLCRSHDGRRRGTRRPSCGVEGV